MNLDWKNKGATKDNIGIAGKLGVRTTEEITEPYKVKPPIFFFFKFIYFERVREHEQGRGRQRARERKSQASSMLSA